MIAVVQVLLVAVPCAWPNIRPDRIGAVLLPHEDGFEMALAAVDCGHKTCLQQSLRSVARAIPPWCAIGSVDRDLFGGSRHGGCLSGREGDLRASLRSVFSLSWKTFEDCAVRSCREPFPAYYIRKAPRNCPGRFENSFGGVSGVGGVRFGLTLRSHAYACTGACANIAILTPLTPPERLKLLCSRHLPWRGYWRG